MRKQTNMLKFPLQISGKYIPCWRNNDIHEVVKLLTRLLQRDYRGTIEVVLSLEVQNVLLRYEVLHLGPLNHVSFIQSGH